MRDVKGSKRILDHGSLPVEKNREREALKVEQGPTTPTAGTQPFDQKEEQEVPSSSTRRRPKWVEQTLRDAEEHVEAPSRTFKESKPPAIFSSYMALMSSISDLSRLPLRRQQTSRFGGTH